ncbi:MAG: hypothetical protein AAFM91_11090 [Pseudomonadota bacterium]
MQHDAAPPSPPAGSDAELTAVFLQGPAKGVFLVVEALRAELLGLSTASDSVAPVKIAWWRDEFARAVDGNPRHPLTRALANATADPKPDWRLFDEHLVLVEAWLRHEQTATVEECRLRLFRQNGPGLYWLHDATSSQQAETSNHVHHVAIARGFAELAEALMSGSKVSRLPFPLEWLGSDTASLTGERRGEIRERCASAGLDELRQCPTDRAGNSAVDVLGALTRGKLKALQRGRAPSRLGRVITAWRAARNRSQES